MIIAIMYQHQAAKAPPIPIEAQQITSAIIALRFALLASCIVLMRSALFIRSTPLLLQGCQRCDCLLI